MIIHYNSSITDITGFRIIDLCEGFLKVSFDGDMEFSISMSTRENAIKHVKTIADHIRDKKEICYLVDENE